VPSRSKPPRKFSRQNVVTKVKMNETFEVADTFRKSTSELDDSGASGGVTSLSVALASFVCFPKSSLPVMSDSLAGSFSASLELWTAPQASI